MRANALLIGALLVLTLAGLSAQPVVVTLHQPPPGQLQYEDLWWLDLQNTTHDTYPAVYLQAEVTAAGIGPVFRANSNEFALPPGLKTIHPRDITVRDPWYLPGYEVFVRRTGALPDGDYTYVITVMPNNLGQGSNQVQIRQSGPPRLIAPNDGGTVPDPMPVFAWLPPSPMPAGPVSYRLRLVEVRGQQTPPEAMAANRSWFEQDGLTQPNLRYPVSARPLNEGSETPPRFAWQVTAFSDRSPIGESEIWWFELGVPGAAVDLGQAEIRDAAELTQNSRTKEELKKILGKADTVNKALADKNERKALAWKQEMLKELNELLKNAKKQGESDEFIKKLQDARRKVEAEIAKEKGTPAPTIDLGDGEIRDASDLTQNSKTRAELKKILGKFDEVRKALARGDEKKALAWKQEALKEINALLEDARKQGESDAFIDKLQKARKKIESEIAREQKPPVPGPDLGGEEIRRARELTQNSRTQAELDKILGKIETIHKALADKDERKAMTWKQDMLKELNSLLGKAKKQGESDDFIKNLQDARRKVEAEIAHEKGTPPPAIDLGDGEIRDASDLTQNSKTRAELKKILGKFDEVRKALDRGDAEKAMTWKQEALKEINALLENARKQGESDAFIDKLQKARKKLEDEIEREK